MKKFFLVLAILIPLSFSCEKEKEFVYEDFQSSTLLRQIKGIEGDMEVMTYYYTGNIFEHVQRFSYRRFLYNKKDQLIKIEIALSLNPLSCAIIPGTDFEAGDDPRKAKIGQYITYEYTDNGNIKIKKSYYINDEHEQLMNYSKYEYENDKVVKINIFNPKDQLTLYYTYLYDISGNVLVEEYYYMQDETEARLQTRKLYEYDDRNNPFKVLAIEGTPGIYTNSNNIIRQITTDYYTEGEQTDTIENAYEYNDSGYPVKANDLEYIYGEEE